MKKSECFKKAQISVLYDEDLTRAEKLEIIDVLLLEESFQRSVEQRKAEQGADNGEL